MPIGGTSTTANKPAQERIFKEVPDGKYSAYVNRIKVDTTKSGKPRLSIGYKIAVGAMQNEWVWDSCTLDSDRGYQIAEKKLIALCAEWVAPVSFCTPEEVAAECAAIMVHLEETKTALKNITVKHNDKGFVTVFVN